MYPSLLVAVAVAVAAPGAKEPKPHPLVGTWLLLTTTGEGRTVAVGGDHCWTFTAAGRRGAHTLDTWPKSWQPRSWQSYELDEKARPPAFVVTFKDAPTPAAQTEQFLFEIDGDTLTVCTREGGRPAALSAEKGSGNNLYKFKRVKPKE